MNKEEEQEYTMQIDKLFNNLKIRNKEIEDLRVEMDGNVNYENFDTCSNKLDRLLLECKMDRELYEDIKNMLEVEHFLEHGNGQNFDREY